MQELLASGVRFTAVLANNDASCFGAAQVLRERGLRIPEDVAMIGFDDLPEAKVYMPSFTTVYNPAFVMGRQALRTMLDVLSGRPPAAAQVGFDDPNYFSRVFRTVVGRSPRDYRERRN